MTGPADTAPVRVAVVTGGARGVGLATARRLLERGDRVALWDADRDALDAALESLASPDAASACVVDVAEPAAVDAAFEETAAYHGQVDILVNSAGIIGDTTSVTGYDPATWRRVLDVNLTGVFLCSRVAAPGMTDRGYGRIVNVASLAGKEGTGGLSAYSASKAGVIALTKSMGKELAETGVLVNAVAPAALDTDMVAGIDPAVVRIMIEKSPMKRMGTAAECAALIGWLASAECSFSTGACFDLSGGRAVY